MDRTGQQGRSAPDLRPRVAKALRASRLAREGGAYTAIDAEQALAAAAPDGRPTGPLGQRTFAVKDLIAVRGHRRGGGSRTREGAGLCGHDAPVVAALRGAGAVFIGLTALHELAFGVTGINAYTGTPAHPLDATRIPGGSSSGSAVAVATGSADLALGTDTGGSIRIPAALCGVVGFKPPFGVWPTRGVLPLAGTLDHVGVLARSVADVIAVDSLFASPVTVPPVVGDPRARLTFGVNRSTLSGSEAAVAAAVERALERLATEHTLVDVELPTVGEVLEVTNTVMFVEAAEVHAEVAADPRSGLGDDVRARLETGLRISADDYAAARVRVRALTSQVRAQLRAVHAVLEPTVPICAPTLAEAPELGLRLVAHTRLANLAGLPSLSLPLPLPVEGLPVGLQITGVSSSGVLDAGALIERALAGT